ncbi:MAG TPA: phosphoglucomutase/phosphomannomutase family protein [Bacteroidia bacterium]|nr:phosphoglucomutase/phosphomannomutase family protein [Bacteroidia bacterium]
MTKIKFGTDGWRAIIAKEYTVENVSRVAEATALWLLKQTKNPSVVLGHDCRFGGKLFAETVAKILAANKIKVFLAEGFVSTPMISLGTLNCKADIGIIITASHNPPEYNGYKLKGSYGGPLLPDKVQEIEDMILDKSTINTENLSLTDFEKNNFLKYIDLETMYCEHVENNFDMEVIINSDLNFAYDAMYGAGQNVMRKLFPEITFMHADYNPSFDGQAPEPIDKNLREFAEMIKISEDIDCGLATDGDADRIGLYDNEGNFIDSHHLILLLIKYLVEQKKYTGKVVTAFSVTPRVKKLCKHFGLENEVVKIGFKYICGIMISEDVLLGGEESGGIAIKGHIPERDGIWMGLVIWEYMAKSGKSLKELIDEIYEIVGSFAFERFDLHIDEEVKNKIVVNCNANKYKSFGEYKIVKTENLDGFKYYFSDDDWLMIRASGTEPVLRLYAESHNRAAAFAILDAAKKELLE